MNNQDFMAGIKEDGGAFVVSSDGFAATRTGGKWTKGNPSFQEIQDDYDAVSDKEAEVLLQEARASLSV